jgi:hypothetical protein
MVTTSLPQQKIAPASEIVPANLTDEVLAFCPRCKAFQTVWFKQGKLVQTRKFNQLDNHIYHDCGASNPCRIYRAF